MHFSLQQPLSSRSTVIYQVPLARAVIKVWEALACAILSQDLVDDGVTSRQMSTDFNLRGLSIACLLACCWITQRHCCKVRWIVGTMKRELFFCSLPRSLSLLFLVSGSKTMSYNVIMSLQNTNNEEICEQTFVRRVMQVGDAAKL